MEYGSPLRPLGYPTMRDYGVFKAHLRMPLPYLKVIVRNYRNGLSEVPVVLPDLINKYHDYLWSRMHMERQQILYKLAGVPPLYADDEEIPSAKGETLRAFVQIKEAIKKFTGKGRVVYLHSDFETEALKAASQIIKAAVRQRITSYMLDFPNALKEIKTWSESELLEKLERSQLACLYMIGKEYSTEFTASNLHAIIAARTVANRVTLLCSHLTPEEYSRRYATPVPGVVLKFTDQKVMATVKELLADLGEEI